MSTTNSAESVLRIGAGLVMLGVPEGLIDIVENKLTEAVKFPLPQTRSISIAKKAAKKVLEVSKNAQVLVVGPGISTHSETKNFITQLITKVRKKGYTISRTHFSGTGLRTDLKINEIIKLITN